ncbi:MAG: TrmH family RNA methyltransferase [Eubacteriales bacterium]
MPYIGEIVTSSQNKYVALARLLGERKQRQKNALFRFDGVKLLCEAATKGTKIEFLLVSESAYDAVFDKAEKLYSITPKTPDCKIIVVSDSVFEKISEENAPEGVITVAKYDTQRHRAVSADEISVGEGENVLLLESVRDPQNVGAIMRTAAAFSVDRVIMSADCADIYNSKTLRASMGAVFSLKIDRVDSICAAIGAVRRSGRRVFAAALDGSAVRLGESCFRAGDCVVIGNEGHGLSEKTISACDASVYIPMAPGVESLNAAVAASVLMWEFFGSKTGFCESGKREGMGGRMP